MSRQVNLATGADTSGWVEMGQLGRRKRSSLDGSTWPPKSTSLRLTWLPEPINLDESTWLPEPTSPDGSTRPPERCVWMG